MLVFTRVVPILFLALSSFYSIISASFVTFSNFQLSLTFVILGYFFTVTRDDMWWHTLNGTVDNINNVFSEDQRNAAIYCVQLFAHIGMLIACFCCFCGRINDLLLFISWLPSGNKLKIGSAPGTSCTRVRSYISIITY